MKTVLRVFAYLKRYPLLGSLQLSCAILMTVLVIVYPQVIKEITNHVIPERQFERLVPLVLVALGAFFVSDLMNALRIVLNNNFEQKVIFDLRSDIYEKIQRLPMTWFDNKRTGDVMTRVTEDVTAMERVLIDGVEQGLVALLQILVIGTYMFISDAKLAFIALIPIPFLAIGALFYTLTAPGRYRLTRQATGDMNSLLHDNIDGIQQIKSYTQEEEQLEAFNRASNAVRRATLKVMMVWAIYNPSMNFLRNVGFALLLGFGGHAVMTGSTDEGTFFAFLFVIHLFYEPVGRLHQLNQMIQAGRVAGERVFAVLDADEEKNPGDEGEELPRPVRGHIQFRDVGFSYTGKGSTLSEIGIEAQPGQTIALVGHTGAGKSTVINLLTRFYEYDAGEIRIDGKPIHDLAKASLRSAIGYVTQESFLFNGTVRENLVLARRDAADDVLWESLRIANAADFVGKLPEGIETNVGERGVKLSVGEKQRISIARSILKNPPILLLDEATASVDTETERLIQEALERLMKNRTSFVIAHRLSTVRDADRIYVLRDGRVVEQGTHDELLDHGGEYAELCRTSLLANGD